MAAIMQGLQAEKYDREYSDKQLFGRLWLYFRKHLGKFVVVALAIVTTSIMSATIPILISFSIKQGKQRQTIRD